MEGIRTLTLSTDTPIKDIIDSFGILNVKREGIGDTIAWPNCFNHSNPSILGDPPLAIITLSAWIDILRSNNLNLLFSFSRPKTGWSNWTEISSLSISLSKQFIIVWELSVTGNIRPSVSVLSLTPLSSNHFTVSVVLNWANAFLRYFPPRG